MPVAKIVIFRYNNLWHDDIEVDLSGELTFAKGDIVWRGGRVWKVQAVSLSREIEEKGSLPTLWAFLAEAKVN